MNKLQNKKANLLQKGRESNERTIVYLSDELVKKRLSIFIGAGCSIAMGLPSWVKLISDIQIKFKISTNEKDLLRIAAKIEKEIGALSFREEIAERIKTHPHSPAILHKSLISLDANLFITTNYDSLIEDALRKEGIAPAVIIQDRDIPAIVPTKKTVVKLHGDINSPSSIIITSNDYLKYNLEHTSFVDWLKSKAVQNTLLFVGTSFTDERLKDADEYVLKRFGEFRRSPCIFLKFPEQKQELSDDDYAIEIDDFEVLCEEFKNKGFHILIIENYDEIVKILDNLNTLVLQKRLQETPTDFATQVIFKTIHVERLEKDLADICDEKVKEICNKVWGEGCMPTQEVMKEQAEALLCCLNEKDDVLNEESKLEGFITLTDVFLNLERKGYISEARKYFDKANAIYQKIENQSKWKERFARITAKLYLSEGKVDEAIGLVSQSKDDKTVSFWLTLLIDSEKFEIGYDFVTKNTIKIPWLPEALYILVMAGKISEAEKEFNEFLLDFEEKRKEKSISTSLYKNEHFYDKVCAYMADAYFRRAIKSTGKTGGFVYPQDMDSDGRILCVKSVEYVDKIFVQSYGDLIKNNLKDYYFAYRSLVIKMQALHFIGDYASADKTAGYIISVAPIAHEAAEHVASRVGFIGKELVTNTIKSLLRDYAEQTWALLLVAILQLDGLKEHEKAWDNALKVLKQSSSQTEKERAAGIIFEIGVRTDKIKEAQIIINDFLSQDSLWREYLSAIYHDSIGDNDRAYEILIAIESKNPVPELNSLCKYMRSLFATKKEKYQEALHLLKESKKIYLNYATLRKLMEVQVKLQDDVGALDTAEEIEKLGMLDDAVNHIKAQAARNAGYFEKAEQAWELLAEKHSQNSEIAYGYADVLALQEKFDDALKILSPFISCDGNMNSKCLMLATHILCATDKEKEAFKLLDKCKSRFQDDPALLMQHTDLGFRVDEEKSAHESLMRLDQLRQENRVPEQTFSVKNLDEIKEFLRRRQETRDKLYEQYRLGKVPRLFFCSYYNLPLYLDWAYRTQPLTILPQFPFRVEFTTYATNGFRVKFGKRSQLVPILVPENTKEIVIDYSALITLHRLGLLPKLSRRFDAIYYPFILKNIWLTDSQRYKHHQASQEKIYRKLHEKFERNLIKMKECTSVPENIKGIAAREIHLAQSENIPLVSAYLEKEEIPGKSAINVLRFHQLLSFIYKKGKITESQYIELKQQIKDKEDFVTEGINEILDNTSQLLFDEITLELAERYELIDAIIDSGLNIVCEKDTFNNIQYNVRSIDFSEDVREWQNDLSEQIRTIAISNKTKLFKDIPIASQFKENRKGLHYYDILAVETLLCSENKKLPLLTDDRFSQMIKTEYLGDKQFGTDALIRDLYDNKIISITEYAAAFLSLCEWRYRFLLPDADIINYFIEQYRNNFLGKPLETIIQYSSECMEDQGIFLGLEPTDPPSICAVKLYMYWVDAWTKALIQIWAGSVLSEQEKEEVTKQIFLRAFPKGPEGLRSDIRKNITAMAERFIITHLFIGTIEYEKPEQFEKLFKYAFDSLGYLHDRRIDELNFYLRSTKDNLKDKDEKAVMSAIASRALKAFYGKKYLQDSGRIDEKLIPALLELGVEISCGGMKEDDLQKDAISTGDKQRIVDFLSDRANTTRRNMDEYKSGPIIFIPPSKQMQGELVLLHDAVMADSLDMRKAIINELLQGDYVSAFTKDFIKERVDNILSEKPFAWHLPAKEVQDVLLKDFLYILHWFHQLEDPRISERIRQDFFNIAMNNVADPNIDSIISSLPLLIQDPFEKDALEERITRVFSEFNIINDALDWYLNNVYFVPYVSNKSSYAMLKSNIKNMPQGEDILEIMKIWLNKNSNDHLAWILALEIILSARSEIRSGAKAFIDLEFYKYLDNILKILINSDKRHSKEGTPEAEFMTLAWSIRKKFARYYLQYLDINMKREFNDERKIALSWWMAKKITLNIIDVRKNYPVSERITFLNNILNVLDEKNSLMHFRHQFVEKKLFSLSRYFIFNISDLLTNATVALFTIGAQENNEVLAGLKYPVAALSPGIRNILLNRLVEDTLFGGGQLVDDSKILILLWNNPLCKSLPVLLKKYYGESLTFLGETIHGKILKAEEIHSFANTLSAKDFLNSELPKLSEYVTKNDSNNIALVITALKAFILTHQEDNFPKELETSFSDATILGKCTQFNKPLAFFICSAFSQILLELQSRTSKKYLNIFYKQFKNVDYLQCDVEITELILSYLIATVMIGGDYDVLFPLLDKKNESKGLRDLLRRMKLILESLLPYVPLGYRDNIRRLLNDLSGIS